MSNVLILDGKEYVPATDAGKHFGYTKDYFLLLAKQGKVDGKKIGHKWYIHLPSAAAFFKKAEVEKNARRMRIREERKRELSHYSKVITPKRKSSVRGGVALVEVFALVVIALSLGVTGYLGTVPKDQAAQITGTGFLERAALSLYTLVSGHDAEVESTESLAVQEPSHESEYAAVSMHVGTTTHTSLVVAPDEVMTLTSIEEIENSFSDEVEVSIDAQNPKTGVIVPQFKDTEGEQYRFLMVPVNQATE